MVSTGCYDLVDLAGWQPLPPQLEGLPSHAHNRLLTSVVLDIPRRRAVAQAICDRLATAKGPTVLFLPTGGAHALDRAGEDLHDAEGLAAFCDAIRSTARVVLQQVPAHINDPAFVTAVLAQFDAWVADGTVKR